jgi:hypothetical protein
MVVPAAICHVTALAGFGPPGGPNTVMAKVNVVLPLPEAKLDVAGIRTGAVAGL